jgi:formylaminopyrimidine deformylase / aminopyrimidine aminohydrolase
VSVAELPGRLARAWSAATRHPFLDGVRDGSVTAAAFDTWLAQDAHFVADLLWFQARLLARAPRPVQAVLAGGAVALVDELAWFEEQGASRGLRPAPRRLPATDAYRALLARLDAAEPAAALTGLWVIERVYLDAWTAALPGALLYRAFVAHWTTPEFGGYVADLERASDLLWASGEPPAEALRLAGDVLAAERAFWDMATEGP